MSETSSTGAVVPDAPQTFAWLVMGPCFAGWLLQVFLTGICMQQAVPFYRKNSTLSRHMRYVLTATLLFNGAVFATTVTDILLWGAGQHRDMEDLRGFKIPDSYMPIPGGLTAFVVQCFFADRAWRVCNKSIIFFCYIALCIIAALAGSCGLGIVQVLNSSAYSNDNDILIFTELWLWSAAVTDLSISVTIIIGLYMKKTGYNMPTDNLVMKIIYASMESASLTTLFALAAASIMLATWQYSSGSLDLIFVYPLPSVYTLSLLWCLSTTEHVRQEQKSRTRSSDQPTNTTITSSESSNPLYLSSTLVGTPFSSSYNPKSDYMTVEKNPVRDFITGVTSLGSISSDRMPRHGSGGSVGRDVIE